MNLEKSAHWLQIIGNLGLLVGLVLVGLQINQSNTIARANAAGVYFQKFQDHQMTLMGENLADVRAKALSMPDKLAPVDIEILKADVSLRVSLVEYMTRMEELGIVNSSWQAEIPEHALYLAGNPVTKELVNRHCFPGRWALAELCKLTLDPTPVPAEDQIQHYIDMFQKSARRGQ